MDYVKAATAITTTAAQKEPEVWVDSKFNMSPWLQVHCHETQFWKIWWSYTAKLPLGDTMHSRNALVGSSCIPFDKWSHGLNILYFCQRKPAALIIKI